jgi:hypothetical protein
LCSSSIFRELGFFLEKQFFDHRAPLRIGRDLEQWPVVLNVLPNDETLHNGFQRVPRGLAVTLALDQNLFANFV